MSYLVNVQIVSIINFFKKNIKTNIKYSIIAVLVSFIIYFTIPKKYVSQASILSSTSLPVSSGGVGSILSQFGGVNLESNANPLFVPDILKKLISSDQNLNKVLLMEITLGENQQTIFENLYEDYDINNPLDFARGKKNFKNNVVRVYKELNAPIINISVETQNPELSLQICNIIFKETINTVYNKNREKNNSKLSFYSSRIEELKENIKFLEADLISFELQNKNYALSPQLLQLYNNKRNEIDLENNVYLDMRLKQESLEIDIKNDTDSLFFIEEPTSSVFKSYPTKGSFILILLLLHAPLVTWYLWRFTKIEEQ